MSLKLRDLIRQVRACKTAAEERAVIAKESAMIRTAIREEQEHYRHRNVAKLLFMHMLGYPTHFGQLECLKLIASPHFPEKRIGYLGMMLLLSEEADVLMLATNSLKNDLNSDNKFVAGLALGAIGNLATSDMSRDLATEVEKHLKASAPYLRKKACLAMSRCLIKCPDMAEDFVEQLKSLLKDRSHGVLITVMQLMTQVILLDEKSFQDEDSPTRQAFLSLVPILVLKLKNLLSKGYSTEIDNSGDPFLQVQILTLLRLLGTNDVQTSEEMNDVLAQVATNTESTKNSGNAILYECVQTIMAIESEESLRVLAINILGRFLLNRDNNIRYVALNTLSKCVSESPQSANSALQRHRATIKECLKDPDVSIRQRALELIYHLVNRENVEDLTGELLNYLVLCPREHRIEICSRVLKVVEKFSPDDRWRLDTLITMLTIAGRECTPEVLNETIIFITLSSQDLRGYAVHKLFKAIRDDDGTQKGLFIVGIWCIGEYGDLLLNPYSYTPPIDKDDSPTQISFMAIEPSRVIQIVEDVLNRHSCSEDIRLRALTCFAKLSQRLASDDIQPKLKSLIAKYHESTSLELQLRSCEFGALINSNPLDSFSGAAKAALARMPVVDVTILQRKKIHEEEEEEEGTTPQQEEKDGGDLLDLEDIFGAPAPEENGEVDKPIQEEKQNDIDLLADIFSAPSNPAPVAPNPTPTAYDPFSLQSDLTAPVMSTPPTPQPTLSVTTPSPLPQPSKIHAFGKDGLDIFFTCRKPEPLSLHKTEITATFKNSSQDTICGLNLQCAVPKYVTMEMSPPTSTTLPVSGVPGTKEVIQTILVSNSMLNTKKLMMKVKISFSLKGQKFEHQFTCNNFPSGI